MEAPVWLQVSNMQLVGGRFSAVANVFISLRASARLFKGNSQKQINFMFIMKSQKQINFMFNIIFMFILWACQVLLHTKPMHLMLPQFRYTVETRDWYLMPRMLHAAPVRRYSVGMAISAYQKGRMLLVSADKPPATGCILFESVDAGRSWVNISDDVADAAALLTEHSPEVFEQAPLAMFVPGELMRDNEKAFYLAAGMHLLCVTSGIDLQLLSLGWCPTEQYFSSHTLSTWVLSV